jgi:hypothetical protein
MHLLALQGDTAGAKDQAQALSPCRMALLQPSHGLPFVLGSPKSMALWEKIRTPYPKGKPEAKYQLQAVNHLGNNPAGRVI